MAESPATSSSGKTQDWFITLGHVSIWIGVLIYIVVGIVLFRESKLCLSCDFDWELASRVGDYIGGFVGPIWALVSALFVYSTFKLQAQTLKSQEATLEAQKGALNEQKSQNQTTDDNFFIQQFDITLSNMMQMQASIKNAIELRLSDTFVWLDEEGNLKDEQTVISSEVFLKKSKDTLKTWYMEYNHYSRHTFQINQKANLDKEAEERDTPNFTNFSSRVTYKCQRFYEGYYLDNFEHYFQHLETLLEVISRTFRKALFANVSRINDKEFYARLLRSQFTKSELFHIFYYSMINERFKQLVFQLNLLEKLAPTDLIEPKHEELLRALKNNS